MKRKLSGQFLEQRWKELAGGQPVTERKDIMSTLVDVKKAANGQVFGILRENAKYFIKVKHTNTNTANAEDFDYIGGVQNKMMESFDSIHDATRRLNAKIYSLNESTQSTSNPTMDILPEETEEELIQKLDDKNSEGDAPADDTPAMDAPADDTPAMDAPADDAPAMDAPADGAPAMDAPAMDAPAMDAPAMDAPAMDAPAMDAPAMDAPADGGEDPLADLEGDAPVEGGEDPLADLEGDAPVEGGETSEEGGEEIQSLLGKLGNLISQNSLSAQQTKNILNTIISSTKDGIEELDFEEKEELAKRIQKDGKKIEEDEFSTTEDNLVADADSELYEEVGQGVDFGSFCQENGFSTNNDDDVIKAIIAYATKHASQEIEADLESVASEINPYIFNKIEQVVDEDFLEELKGVLSFEQMNLGSQSGTLNESHLDKVITKLVLAMIENK